MLEFELTHKNCKIVNSGERGGVISDILLIFKPSQLLKTLNSPSFIPKSTILSLFYDFYIYCEEEGDSRMKWRENVRQREWIVILHWNLRNKSMLLVFLNVERRKKRVKPAGMVENFRMLSAKISEILKNFRQIIST